MVFGRALARSCKDPIYIYMLIIWVIFVSISLAEMKRKEGKDLKKKEKTQERRRTVTNGGGKRKSLLSC